MGFLFVKEQSLINQYFQNRYMEQRVYYFRETLMGSNELSLPFWFVSNICELNIINCKWLKKKKSKTSPVRVSLPHQCLRRVWDTSPPCPESELSCWGTILGQDTTVHDASHAKRKPQLTPIYWSSAFPLFRESWSVRVMGHIFLHWRELIQA